MPSAVLDASAVLAWTNKERGWETIDKLLAVAVIPAPNLTEVFYRPLERGFTAAAATLHALLRGTGLTVEPATEVDSIRAAELIATSRAARTAPNSPCLSLGDGLCIAVAERLALPVVGGDEHWETLDLWTRYMPFR